MEAPVISEPGQISFPDSSQFIPRSSVFLVIVDFCSVLFHNLVDISTIKAIKHVSRRYRLSRAGELPLKLQKETSTNKIRALSLGGQPICHHGEPAPSDENSLCTPVLTIQSAPRVIAELVVTGIRVLGKATAAAGAQAVKSECMLFIPPFRIRQPSSST